MQTLNKKEIAALLGCDVSSIDAYRKKGMPTIGNAKATTYPVAECVAWIINHKILQDRDKQDKTPEGMTESQAIARKAVAEALMKETQLGQLRGTLVNIEDAEKELEHNLSIVRGGLLAFPARSAPFLVQVPDENSARQLLDEQIRQLMTAIATQLDAPEEEANESE